ncbi:hypothetical protein BT96DRAFT_938290 [Gymnopus androsaceus JB14]|uniref:F-box domain-containing protein n=1 Tax=Gymnopus androsaceus JB14 TaxID=1447944 RepID=A0A6A4HRC8_9AGAR|nr:hypothetical protein BT96DRAFT_938290 [Gymnopus androsaceus JB14]
MSAFAKLEMAIVLKSLVLPVEQLTSLIINSRHWSTGFDLAQAKNLVNLTLDTSESFDANFSLCLPALRILDVSFRDIPTNPLQGLTIPLLEDLTLRWLTQDIHDLARDVIAFQNRSSAAISSLTLGLYAGVQLGNTTPGVFTENFISIFAAFPTVRTFRVLEEEGCRYPSNSLLRTMIYTKGRPVVFPKLTDLELYMVSYPPDLTSMISSRRWPEPDVLDVEDDNDGVLQLQNVNLLCSGR